MTDVTVTRVRDCLTDAVPRWYGPGSHLACLAGPRQHAWSFQFDLTAEVPGGLRFLVVKIPRWEEARTLEAALAAGPQEGTRREHAALQAVDAAVAAKGDTGLAAVVPVAYLPGLNAVVTERLEAVPLRSRLGPRPGSEGRHAQVLQRAGRWLRLYHEKAAGASAGHFDGAAAAGELQDLAARQAAAHPSLQKALEALAREARDRDGAPAVVGLTHGDFNLANVLVTADGRVAALDPNLVPGPVLADVAKLLADLRLRRARLLTGGRVGNRGVKVAEAAFLEGYGPTDAGLLGFLRGVATVRRWVEMEEHLAGLPGPLRRAAAAAVRSYPAAESSRRAG